MTWRDRSNFSRKAGRLVPPEVIPPEVEFSLAPGAWHQSTDATRKDHYNFLEHPGVLPWKNANGDWVDSEGTEQGGVAYITPAWDDSSTPVEKTIVVTTLIQEMINGSHSGDGIYLRAVSGGSQYTVATRFHTTLAAPELRLVYSGSSSNLDAVHTCPIDSTTTTGRGNQQTALLKAGTHHFLLRFDLSGEAGTLVSATLALQVVSHFDSTALNLAVYRTEPKTQEVIAVETGIADSYIDDVGIGADLDVIEYLDFKIENGSPRWAGKGANSFWVRDAVNERASITIPNGAHLGGSIYFSFALQDPVLTAPTEVYFRYYLMLDGQSWTGVASGGKFPGFGGQDADGEAQGGNGGQNTTGTNGWSARGQFSHSPNPNQPMAGRTALGHYVYHIDDALVYANQGYGEIAWWGGAENLLPLIEVDTWYCIDQRLKLNTYSGGVGAKDGILEAWIDGKKVFSRTNYRWVSNADHPIDWIWFDIYHGGDTDAIADHTMYVADIVIATAYIGPKGTA